MRTQVLATVIAALSTVALVVYGALVRPWSKRWGATDDEVRRSLPGDSIVAKADYVATRAITIQAPPRDVWPWLMQIGSGRAGWYSYDRLDNDGVASADRLLPEFQSLAVDDLVPMIPGSEVGVWVKEIDPSAACCGGTARASTAGSGCSSLPGSRPPAS